MEADADQIPEPFGVLFVCSGNTCRSPTAAALARRELEGLGWSHVEVRSAGTGAAAGEPASEGARRVAERHGLSLEDHRSTPVDEALVEWADLVLVMSPAHLLAVLERGGEGKTAMLDAFARGDEESGAPGWGVPDPFGGDDEVYEETYRTLETLVSTAVRRLEPIVAP